MIRVQGVGRRRHYQPMQRYTFTFSGDRDPSFAYLETDAEAWSEAVQFLGVMLHDINGELPNRTDWRIDVTGENGSAVATLHFSGQRFG
jgi:hypothetical protein